MPEHLSLYIHVPFCKRKCPYCDFFSVTDLSVVPAYVDGVCKEIRLWADLAGVWSRMPVHTVYFGGGTPSLLSLDQMRQILDTVQHHFCLAAGPEITVEVNPGTVDDAFLAGLRHLGINRLSIGAQSFDPQKLSYLSRIHTRDQVFDTLAGAARAGFANLGLDLIYGLPNETPDVWQKDLEAALGCRPVHLSCYMLTIEPGTPFFDRYENSSLFPCDRDRRTDFFVQTAEVLESYGYIHYEVSNFALGKEHQSVHNSWYWERGGYLGMGPSAHSFFPLNPGGPSGRQSGPVRSWNPADIHAWLNHLAAGCLPGSGYEVLTPVQERMEKVMLGLRTKTGIPAKMPGPDTHALMVRLADEGLGVFFYPPKTYPGSQRFRLTRSGLICLDSIVEAFVWKMM